MSSVQASGGRGEMVGKEEVGNILDTYYWMLR